MQTSPYDENWNLDLDMLAVQMQLNHPMTYSLVDTTLSPTCGGCNAPLKSVTHDDRGREVRDYECRHRYIVGAKTVIIERV